MPGRDPQLVDARDGSSRPASDVATAEQIAAAAALCPGLEGKTERQRNPLAPGSLPWMSWIIGRLGGWNCYYKPPGPKTMRDGWQLFAAKAEGFALARQGQNLMGTDPKDSSKQIATPYDAGESGASNLGPTNKALIDRVSGDIAKAGSTPVPGDMVTTSGSGLDPDISPQTALRQVARVAKARGLAESEVAGLVQAHVKPPTLGFLGGARVNVLELNLALDSGKASTKVAEGTRHGI